MRRSAYDQPPAKRGLLLGLWLMVAVVVLSALPTQAQPRSRIVGSAFDPGSVSVLVKTRDEHPAARSEQRRKQDPDTSSGAAVPVSSRSAARPFAAGPVLHEIAAAAPPHTPRLTANAPRAPPFRKA
ncbi:hypothetical protein [Croceicoccus sp. Ery15]|uniref:hypothetical protein n=1 Tax=Croceicoccus sp. Ery15 TaxID=1703338 RepID=UPI001E4685A1|nr:hypothetical protein [Croceicoccus sp. Ery15]